MNKNQMVSSLMLWGLMLSSVFFFMKMSNQAVEKEIKFPEFISAVESNRIESVTFQGNNISGKFKDIEVNGTKTKGEKFKTYGDTSAASYLSILKEKNVVPEYLPVEPSFLGELIRGILPILILTVLLIVGLNYLSKKGTSGFNNIMKAGKIKGPESSKVKFSDVAGIDEVKEEVSEIVEFLKNPQKFKDMGAKIPSGVLLHGGPGTGKTLLAKAIAHEAKVPFIPFAGSNFVEMFVGVGAGRVRSLFEEARKNAPCIIFIDEIDAVAKKRGAATTGGHNEQEQTLNQILVEMDGFDTSEGIIIIAATNRVDHLDPAILRPGRFDRKIYVPSPDMKGREAILKVHAKSKKIEPNFDFEKLSKATSGMTGADLENLLNEAALLAARKNAEIITMKIVEEARDKIIMGTERRTLVLKDTEKEKTAWHEAGHALITLLFSKNLDKLHKVSIIPRGMALGVTQVTPEDNQISFSKEKALDFISMLMGGRAAEDLKFQEFSSGASDDLKKATMLARKMICEWGMSDKLGAVSFNQSNNAFENNLVSESTMKMIDEEIRSILEKCYNRTKETLTTNQTKLEKIAKALLEKETCTGEEISELIKA